MKKLTQEQFKENLQKILRGELPKKEEKPKRKYTKKANKEVTE